MQEQIYGRWFIIAAAVLWSTSGILSKTIALPGPTMAFYRALFACLVLLPFLRKSSFTFTKQTLLPLLQMAMCFSVMNMCVVTAMTETTAANAIFLQYTAPIFMFVGSVLWLKEPFEKKGVPTLGLGMAGILVIVVSQWQDSPKGIALALGSGVTYAGVALFLRRLRQYDPLWLTAVNQGSAALTLLPFVVWGDTSAPFTGHQWSLLVVFGVLQMGLPYLLFSRGLKGVSAQEAGILTLLEPVLNPLWTFLGMGERPSPFTVVGGLLILTGIALRYAQPAAFKRLKPKT